MKTSGSKSTEVIRRMELTDKDILKLLNLTNMEGNATVTFRVPGGGDWSNCDVDVDKDTPIIVTIKTRTYEQLTD